MIVPTSLLPSRLLAPRLVAAPPRSQRQQPKVHYVLGRAGRPAEVPTLLIAVFDNSGSVICPTGTDPLSNRFAEVEQAFAAVVRKGARHELGAIIHFDTPSSAEVGPVPITRQGLPTLQSGLRIPPDGPGTSQLAPSLARARELAEAHPEYEVTLVVLSDFLLTDPDPTAVLSDLAAFPGAVHAVVLGTHLPAGVLDESITVTHIGRDDPPGAAARAIFTDLVAHRPGSAVAGRSSSTPQPKFRRQRPPQGAAVNSGDFVPGRTNDRARVRPIP